MEKLDAQYLEKLKEIKEDFLASEVYEKFMESEEEEDFQMARELFEPRIALLYEEVADKRPLQLPELENLLLDDELEGLYTPKLLGFSVLRGNLSRDIQYTRPQDHFKKILLFICHSANFDFLKKRIGQTIQIGFALSSDIWITNLINEIANRKIRYFLQGQKLKKYREAEERLKGYRLYERQFRNENFYTAYFPKNTSELKVYFPELFSFLKVRVKLNAENDSLIPSMLDFLENQDFYRAEEYLQFIGIFLLFYETHNDKQEKILADKFNAFRKDYSEFEEEWFRFLLDLFESELKLDDRADRRAISRIDSSIDDEISAYYKLAEQVHSKGYMNDEVIDEVRVYHSRHEGLSDVNECVRLMIYRYFRQVISNLEITEYHELFEQSKLFPVYISIFNNELFNKRLKDTCMAYIKRLLKHYTDKRGKDYQDIKKFVSATFLELGFLTEKQIVELFKTRRKKKKVSS